MPSYEENLQKIVKLANEVLSIYPTFLGDWVFANFKVPMSAHLAASRDIHYDWLLNEQELPMDTSLKLPDEWLKDKAQSDVGKNLIVADNWLKKARVVLQITWDDMVDLDAKNEFNPKVKNIFNGMVGVQDKIIETMAIDQIRVQRDPPLSTELVPDELKNMPPGEERNLRDWIFLRDTRNMMEGISQIFGKMVVEFD